MSTINHLNRSEQLTKLLRFAGIYGWRRAFVKAVARTRPARLRNPFVRRGQASVSLIGCGQFAFSCICYYLQKQRGNVFLNALDTDSDQAASLSRYYGFRAVARTPADLFNNPALRLLYVVSNHASHTDYAVEGLKRGLTVYVEKPVSVSYRQLVQLAAAQRSASGCLFAGYNRPYSAAIRALREYVLAQASAGSFSINYFISGHVIPASHWYRNPDEGTRVCGNLGHWIDLTVHIWQWRSLPDWIAVTITYANPDEPDDNLCVTFSTDRHDLVSLTLTARSEPFEGINESINLQHGEVIAHINDFRTLTLWQGSRKYHHRYSPKDVGHQRTVLQPYHAHNRDWQEVNLSTLLMLHIKDMVVDRQTSSRFIVQLAVNQLESDIQRELTTLTLATQV